MTPPFPSLDFLLETSDRTIRELELAALDRHAQALKRAKLEMDEAIAQRELAGVCRWLIDNRAGILDAARRTVDLQVPLEFPQRKTA